MEVMQNIPPEMLWLIVATIGGLARVSQRMIVDGPTPLVALAHVIVSAFSGMMAALFTHQIGMMGNSLLLAAGLGGWAGVEMIEYLRRKTFK